MASAQRILRFLAGRFRDTQSDGKVYALKNGALLDVTNITQKALATVPLTVTSAGQTQFTVPGGYTPGLLQVARNGILQSFTGTDGSTITLSSGTSSTSDIVTAYVFSVFQVANALMLSGGTMTGSLVSPGISMTGGFNAAPIVSLASAATVNIGAAAANDLTITGTTTITAFDTVASGVVKRLTFAGSLTLTYNATKLILPGAASITTGAGDSAVFVSLGSGNWRCVGYQRYSPATALSDLSGAPARTDFISGLLLGWVSSTQVSISPGLCRMPDGSLLELSASTTLTLSSPAASTQYHVYGFGSAGALSIEISSTAPVVYRNTAQNKNGDTTRRYLGSFRTNASSAITLFMCVDGYFFYLPSNVAGSGSSGSTTEFAQYRLVSGDSSTTSPSPVDMSSYTPPASRLIKCRHLNTNAPAGVLVNGVASTGAVVTVYSTATAFYLPNVQPLSSMWEFYLYTPQKFWYAWSAAPNNGVGYYFDYFGHEIVR